jgi:pimeloyl-ACP methyl ester carboxylesterase
MSLPRTLLGVHGAGGGGWEWDLWRPVLAAAGWSLHTPDLRPSAAGLEATGFADYLGQLRAHAAAVPASVLLGASLGGLLALALASERPPAALVLVNPLPPLPEAVGLPARAPYPPRVCWGSEARLAGTAAALADADIATVLTAYRRWRDESGALLNAARAGLGLPALPELPVLVLASAADGDVPPALSAALALRLRGSLLRLPGGHLDPLLGGIAAATAEQVVGWLNALPGFRSN